MIERKERGAPMEAHHGVADDSEPAAFLLVVVILPMYAVNLNRNKFLGFPLGYFLSLHGIVLIAVVTVASFVNRQDAIDHSARRA